MKVAIPLLISLPVTATPLFKLLVERLDNRQLCVIHVLADRLSPDKRRVCVPCRRSAGMFVQCEKFVEEHGGI